MADRLRPLWDFDDLDASEARLGAQLDRETSEAGRAEVLTQLARVEGLRGDFEACDRLLAEAEPLAGSDPAANVRLQLEHGRRYRSSGDTDAALPFFRAAWERARGWAVSQAVGARTYYTPENNPALYHEAESWLELVLSDDG